MVDSPIEDNHDNDATPARISRPSSVADHEGSLRQSVNVALVTESSSNIDEIDILISSEEEAIEVVGFASWLMAEEKAKQSLSALNTAIHLFRRVIDHRLPTHPLYSDALHNLQCALVTRTTHTGELSDLAESMRLQLEPHSGTNDIQHEDNTPSGQLEEDDDDVKAMERVANILLSEFNRSISFVVCDTVIFLLNQALPHLASLHDTRLTACSTLAEGLYARHHHHARSVTSDLDAAICALDDALKICKNEDQERELVMKVTELLFQRFLIAGNASDMEAIIPYLMKLIAQEKNAPDDLFRCAVQFQELFEDTGNINHLDTSVQFYRKGMRQLLEGSDDLTRWITNLASALLTRFKHSGQESDLEEAISLYRTGLKLQPSHHPLRPLTLNYLACALIAEFEHGVPNNILDEVITLLANALCLRFSGENGQQSDIDEAVRIFRQVLELQPEKSSSLENVASTLWLRFQKGRQQSDLDEAVTLLKQALDLRPWPDSERFSSLNNLSCVLWMRFGLSGQKSDLDDAISIIRQALELTPSPHPGRCASLTNLATFLSTRYTQGGQQTHQDEAVSLVRETLELQPVPHPERFKSLDTLASMLTYRFERQCGQRADLYEAISLKRQALELQTSSHPDRVNLLSNLAVALSDRFKEDGVLSDLDEAISTYRHVLQLQTPSHPFRHSILRNLAKALLTGFASRKQKSEFDEAISMHREVLELRPLPDPNRSMSLNDLATALCTRYEYGGSNDDFEEAVRLWSSAVQYRFQSSPMALSICTRWIIYAKKHCHTSLLAAYDTALQILPKVAALSLTMELRHHALDLGTDGLARDASQCAIQAGSFSKAVELLEAGKSVFWAQVLSLRSPFDRLCGIQPDYAKFAHRLQIIARELETGTQRNASADILDNRTRLSIDEESSRLNRLHEEWEEIILKVRGLPGYEDFLRPPCYSTLKTAASNHPIVLLIANSDESHCLIITSTTQHHIGLPDMGAQFLSGLVYLVRMTVSDLPTSRSMHDGMQNILLESEVGRYIRRGISFQDDGDIPPDLTLKIVLVILWEMLVKPVIDLLDIKKSDNPPIIQWCATGYFTFLPIHAAGIYADDNSVIDSAADYFISSYTPTIGILIPKPSPTPPTFKMMAVIQPHELPSTNLELQKIQDHVPHDALISMGIPGSPASVETVASHLSEVSIAHFACHGHQNPSQPLDSWLKLDDGQLKISRIIKEEMPNGGLAFLSACETAMGDKKLPDEAMSLAASLFFCGFKRVVGTMWMIKDEDGPVVADAFYRELFRGPNGEKTDIPDVSKSAYALHAAVKELRSRNVSYRRWVPFIHMGQC